MVKLTRPETYADLVCLGMDAFRIAIGLPTRNYSAEQVAKLIAYLAARTTLAQAANDGGGEP